MASPLLQGSRGRALLCATVVVASLAALVGLPAAPGQAVQGTQPVTDMAQVRIIRNGLFRGGGTLVDRNWVLTSAHLIGDLQNPGAYAMRFGVLDDQDDAHDPESLRQIDRIELSPHGGLAMVHFAAAVPEDTPLASIATQAPHRWDPLVAFGWGDLAHPGAALRAERTLAYDPAATRNANEMRFTIPGFSDFFPPGVDPMAIPARIHPGDGGSGTFLPPMQLAGIHVMTGSYHRTNHTGNAEELMAAYEQPVWRYRSWILDTINGAGPAQVLDEVVDGPPRSRLADAATGDHLPMTLPPPSGPCASASGACLGLDPGWALGALLGSGNYRGTALARCASDGSDACVFGAVTPTAGASARLALGPRGAPLAPGTRQVMVWCRTTTAFPDAGSPARQVLRVSFTNADPTDSVLGYGWWDVTPDQVGTGAGQTLLDPGPLQPC